MCVRHMERWKDRWMGRLFSSVLNKCNLFRNKRPSVQNIDGRYYVSVPFETLTTAGEMNEEEKEGL